MRPDVNVDSRELEETMKKVIKNYNKYLKMFSRSIEHITAVKLKSPKIIYRFGRLNLKECVEFVFSPTVKRGIEIAKQDQPTSDFVRSYNIFSRALIRLLRSEHELVFILKVLIRNKNLLCTEIRNFVLVYSTLKMLQSTFECMMTAGVTMTPLVDGGYYKGFDPGKFIYDMNDHVSRSKMLTSELGYLENIASEVNELNIDEDIKNFYDSFNSFLQSGLLVNDEKDLENLFIELLRFATDYSYVLEGFERRIISYLGIQIEE